MGDFCVSGFHSQLPIHRGNKVVAIVCRRLNNITSNVPCYLDGHLSPLAMPIIGHMGDYGTLDDWEESETVGLFEKYLNVPIGDLFESISRCSQYTENDELPEIYKKLDRIREGTYSTPSVSRYAIIYEHYSVYKAFTGDMPKYRDYVSKISGFLNDFRAAYPNVPQIDAVSGVYPNIFSNFIHPCEFITWLKGDDEIDCTSDTFKHLKDEFFELRKLSVKNRGITNVGLDGFCCLYYMGECDYSKMIDEIIDWTTFINTLSYLGGHFYYSVNAGQSWHHDEDYWKWRKDILNTMIKTIDEMQEADKNDFDYSDEDDDLDDEPTSFISSSESTEDYSDILDKMLDDEELDVKIQSPFGT